MATVPVPAPADRSWLEMTGATPVLARLRSAAARLVSATRSRLPGVTQAAGVASVSAGVFVLAGLGVGLVVTGVLAVGLGVLFEPTSKGR